MVAKPGPLALRHAPAQHEIWRCVCRDFGGAAPVGAFQRDTTQGAAESALALAPRDGVRARSVLQAPGATTRLVRGAHRCRSAFYSARAGEGGCASAIRGFRRG